MTHCSATSAIAKGIASFAEMSTNVRAASQTKIRSKSLNSNRRNIFHGQIPRKFMWNSWNSSAETFHGVLPCAKGIVDGISKFPGFRGFLYFFFLFRGIPSVTANHDLKPQFRPTYTLEQFTLDVTADSLFTVQL